MRNNILLLLFVFMTVSCGKLEDKIDSLQQRINELENVKVPSLESQISSINGTIKKLETTDASLQEHITALESKSVELKKDIDNINSTIADIQKSLREEIANTSNNLSGEIASAKADVIAQLEAYKTLTNEQIKTLNSAIDTLKIKVLQKFIDFQS